MPCALPRHGEGGLGKKMHHNVVANAPNYTPLHHTIVTVPSHYPLSRSCEMGR